MIEELEKRVAVLEAAVLALGVQEFGDVQGHLFHGNQWTPGFPDDPTGKSGGGNDGKPAGDPGASKAADAPFPRAENKSGYGLSPSYRTREYTQGGRIMGGEVQGKAAAVLPTGSSVNLVKGKGDYIENVERGTTHVVDIGRKREYGDEKPYVPNLRAVSTSGGPVWNVGDKVYMNHDQNPGRSLVPAGNYQPENGTYGSARVVGTLHEGGRAEGVVPDKAIPHWVFK